MKRRMAGTLVVLALVAPALADQEFDALMGDFAKAQQAWYEQYQQAQKNPGDMVDITKLPPRPEEKFAPKFKAYAEKHLGEPAAIPALSWLISNPVMGLEGPDMGPVQWAIDQLGQRYAGSPEIKDVLQPLEYAGWTIGRKPVTDLCQRILEKNKDDEVRAGAMFVLGSTLMNELIDGPGRDPQRAEKLLRDVVRLYPKSDYAKRAGGYIFEIEHLQVGMKAPEIVGKSVDGTEIKLSQFAGQVVVLDFWGFW